MTKVVRCAVYTTDNVGRSDIGYAHMIQIVMLVGQILPKAHMILMVMLVCQILPKAYMIPMVMLIGQILPKAHMIPHGRSDPSDTNGNVCRSDPPQSTYNTSR